MGESLFAGLRVVDCASFVAAPGAATLLGDFGADVIKLEPPEGDAYRYSYLAPGQPVPTHNHFWMIGSRGKRSLALDLKAPEGIAVLERLLATTDVFITNFPLPVRRRLGIGYEDLAPRHPRLIYASFTAFGETGPEVDQPGFDSIAYWARSGLMDLMRANRDAPPVPPTGGLGDNPAGVMLYAAIASALYRRERTGLGGLVTSSLLAAGLWTNSLPVQMALCGQHPPDRVRREQSGNACVNTYRCRDGRWFNLMVLNEDKLFGPLVEAIGHPALRDDPRFATLPARRENAEALIAILDETFATRDLAEWRAALAGTGVTFAAISTLDDVVADAQAHAVGAIRPFADDPAVMTVDAPFAVEGSDKVAPTLPPALGEHSVELLEELGFDGAEIGRLRDTRVVVTP